MLENLALRNFKAWQELDIAFGQVTALFGTNSSGKSSLLHFLLMLKQTKNATDRRLVLDFGGPDGLVNLGSFQDVVHGQDESAKISWRLAWASQSPLNISDPDGLGGGKLLQGRSMQTACSVGSWNSRLRADVLTYWFGKSSFTLQTSSKKSTKFSLKSGDDNFRFLRNPGRPGSLPGPVKTHLFPDRAKTLYQNTDFLGDFEFAYETLMDRIFYLGPLREYPKREYMWAGAGPADVGQRGERTIDAILAATARGERRHLAKRKHYRAFQEFIAHWLKEIGLIESFRVQEIAPASNLYRAIVKKDGSGPEVPLTDVGFGVSQVLPALVLLFSVPEGSIVLMEQPEIHLHPSVSERAGRRNHQCRPHARRSGHRGEPQ